MRAARRVVLGLVAAATAAAPGGWAHWYGRLPFARKLRLFPALTATALSLVLAVTIGFGLYAERRMARLADEYYPTVEATWQLQQTLAELQRAFQDAVASGDEDDLARVDSLATAFQLTLRAPAGGTTDPDHAQIGELFAAYVAAGRDASTRLIAGEVGAPVSGALDALAHRHRALKGRMAADARDDRAAIVRAFAAERGRQRVAWVACLAITLGFVVVVGVLSHLSAQRLTVPLAKAVRAADRVAEGDLGVALPDAGGDEVGQLLRSMQRMVVNLRRSEDRLVHQATHDALTGLANRALLRERAARATAGAGGLGSVALLFIDLDNFKAVNDGLGHEAGDRLLVLVAERLRHATRGCDTVARLGGDEFAVLLTGVSSADEAAGAADRVAQALAASYDIGGTRVRTGTSVGIALGADAEVADDLLHHADMAMYAAKRDGKGRYELFRPEMRADALDRLALESDLRGAVERGELAVHYQPIVSLVSGRVTGAEALVRWRHPARGMVSPAEFIPLAEQAGLIEPIGRWVLEEACRQAAAWRRGADEERGHAADAGASAEASDDARVDAEGAFTVAVNVSAWQVRHPGLIAHVQEALAASGLPPSALTLEITESVMLTDADATLARLGELKAIGVTLALDDFGTGYSSLGYLQRLPVDYLKIDRSFVANMGGGSRHAALTRAIVALGRELGLGVVAEGIERAEQADALRHLGCGLGQGYYFARPLTADALTVRLAEQRAADAAAAAGLLAAV